MKNNKEYKIIFYENKDNTNKEQIELFRKVITTYIQDKVGFNLISNVSTYDKKKNAFSFNLKLDSSNSVFVIVAGKKVIINSGTEQYDQIIKDEEFDNTLCVVDLRLDKSDNDKETGKGLGKFLKLEKQAKVLFTSGNNVYQENGLTDSAVQRATLAQDGGMNEHYSANMPSIYHADLERLFDNKENSSKSTECYDLLHHLLCSGYVNKQYFGVVLLKLMCMMDYFEGENN